MKKIAGITTVGVALAFSWTTAVAAPPPTEPIDTGRISTTTWSVVAADPVTGDVGVAGASCVDTHVDLLAALVPGSGAAAVQADFDLRNRDLVFSLLKKKTNAKAVVTAVTKDDADRAGRQYGVVTVSGGKVEIAAFTGAGNDAWAGSEESTKRFALSVQGNTLVSDRVVSEAVKAFNEPADLALPDRLMRALEAGSAAGGDLRCNVGGVKQTAATAFILMARGGDAPFATKGLDKSVIEQTEKPFLALSVQKPFKGANPLLDLRHQYDQWRGKNLPACPGCDLRPIVVPPGKAPTKPRHTPPGVPSTGQ